LIGSYVDRCIALIFSLPALRVFGRCRRYGRVALQLGCCGAGLAAV
jgi:hypothetical protein